MIEKFKKPLMITKSSLPGFDEYVDTIKSIWESSWLTNQGPLHNRLERELMEYLRCKNITLFVNGHLALDCTVKSLRTHNSNGCQIITTPFTFVSTIHAISTNGYTPVFCDIKMSDYTIDEDKIEDLITEKTVAIMPVHVYGFPCNVDKIQKIADKYNLKVIYDAAHAFAVEINNIPIGNFGDISMFSFHATKIFNTIEGGALTYKNDEFKREFDLLKNFGILNEEEIVSSGINAKMNEFQAAMGIENLKYIDQNIKKRGKITNIYTEYLSKIPGIILAKPCENTKLNYSYFPILIDEKKFNITRDHLFEKLKSYNVFTRKYFHPLISDIDIYRDLNPKVDVAEYVSKRILCLPLSSNMELEDAHKVSEIIKEIWKDSSR